MKVSFYMLLYRAFHAQRKCLRPFMAELGLAPGQPKVLLYLAGHDGCMQKDVAEHCDIEPRAGYIGKKRFYCPQDDGGKPPRRQYPDNGERTGSCGKVGRALSRGGGFHADRIYGGGDGAVWRFFEPGL